MGQKYLSYTAAQVDAAIASINTLKEQYELIQYYQSVPSGTSGSVTVPTGYTIELNRFGDGLDAVITSEGTDGKPLDKVSLTGAGVVVTTTLDGAGAYALSGTPAVYPVDIVYYLKGKRDSRDNLTFANIIGDSEPLLSNSYTGTSTIYATSEKALSDGLATKQNTLVSGTNIKTINSTTLLGSGNLEVQAVLTNPVTGTGTSNYVSKFTGTSTIGNSAISDNGVGVTISYLTGATTAIVTASTLGALSTISVITGKLADATAITNLTTAGNWNTDGVYTGTTITGTYEGQYYKDDNYFYFAYSDNDWLRTPRA